MAIRHPLRKVLLTPVVLLFVGGLAKVTCAAELSPAVQPAAEQSHSPLDVVKLYADTMIEHGSDKFGPVKTGLLLSALDRTTLAPLTARPAAPGGARREDRSGEAWMKLVGANVHLDENLLRVFYALSEITGDPKYAKVADNEQEWFFKHTLSPATNLLPWGEHLCWDTLNDKPITGMMDEGMHEFARPWVLWDRSYALAPQECEKFAMGLWKHQIKDHKTGGFDRHAPYAKHGPVDGKDFPRHAGFYVLTWAAAYQHTKDPTYLKAIETLVARFERKRVQKNGSLTSTMGPLDVAAASKLVPEQLAERLKTFALKEDELIIPDLQKMIAPNRSLETKPRSLWQAGYSSGTEASTAMFCLARYDQVGNPAYRDILIGIADKYIGTWPDEDVDCWPMSFGHAISTQAAAYRLTKKPIYLHEAQRFSQLAIDLFFQNNPLPRASLKTGHYESLTGPDTLALALLETYALTHDIPSKLPINSIDR